MKWLLVFVVASLALALAACGDDDDTVSPTPTQASPSATATTVTASPTATSSFTEPRHLIFIRPSTGFPYHGPIWEADLDGSDPRQLTPDGADAKFAGVVKGNGHRVMYYVKWDGETARSLWSLDLTTLAGTHILDFESGHPQIGDAAVNPDGVHVAFSDGDGSVVILDLQTRTQRIVVQGNRDACSRGAAGCYSYIVGSWSPDGTKLILAKRYWEGGDAMVIDPFAEPAGIILDPGEDFHPSDAEWSTDGNGVCGWGLYAAPSGLYVASAPDWTFRNLIPEYEAPNPGPPPLAEHWVGGCAWLDSSRIAFAVDEVRQPALGAVTHEAHVSVYDLDSESILPVLSVPASSGTLDVGIVALGDGRRVVMEYAVGTDSSSMHTVNEIVDVTTGERQSILEPGDQVVAVVP